MLFSPISSLNSKNYPRNINYMPPVILRVCLDLSEKPYCRTASYELIGNQKSIRILNTD